MPPAYGTSPGDNACATESPRKAKSTSVSFLRVLRPEYQRDTVHEPSTGHRNRIPWLTCSGIPIVGPADLAEQRAIAHILGTLDDKIELNRRMNETLEAMARALFKSWFVDFDPVRAKADDRDPGLPKPLADLFPARLVDSELGEIPEGWEVLAVVIESRT